MEVSRRELLKSTVTTTALYTTGTAAAAVNSLIPYVIPPERIEPGEWVTYATTCRECPAGCGMHVLCRDGRVVKAEGNPNHPVNRGGLCPRGQASVQGLYNPGRLKKPFNKRLGIFQSWDESLGSISHEITTRKGSIYIITDLQTTMQLEKMKLFLALNKSPQNLLIYEPFDYSYLRQAYNKLFGEPIIPYIDLSKADLIVSICADFLEVWISNVQFAWQFIAAKSNFARPCKSVYLGPRLSLTAANCDRFFLLSPGEELSFICALLGLLRNNNRIKNNELIGQTIFGNRQYSADKAVSETAQLLLNSKYPVFLIGPTGATGDYIEKLALAVTIMNHAIGAIPAVIDTSSQYALSETMDHQQFDSVTTQIKSADVVLICNRNIAYERPASMNQIRKAGTIVYSGIMKNETSEIADYVLPLDHFLETWADYAPYSGLVTMVQPAMRRLYDTRNIGEIMDALVVRSGKQIATGTGFSELTKSWGTSETLLKKGFVQVEPKKKQLNIHQVQLEFDQDQTKVKPTELKFYAYGSVLLFDGRVADRPWLQENPEPLSSAVWGNCAEIHPSTAAKYHIDPEHEMELSTGSQIIRSAVRITESVAQNVIALGYGQGQRVNEKSKPLGANAFVLTAADNKGIWFFPTVSIRTTDHQSDAVLLQATVQQYNSDAIRWVSLSDLNSGKAQIQDVTLPLPSGYKPNRDLYAPHEHRNHRWAMVVDLNRCIGCQACAIACYAENNIPVMGKSALARGREMAWMKVVPYKQAHGSRIAFLPMFCQHCDAAPCEPVCPVFAAVHNEEGLNAQIYNRCIGTRYCSNNCPYKVRRFNWFNTHWPDPLQMQLNPEVTVRSRGVMEKCTFCIQRISQVEHIARRENRRVQDGEVKPACVQSCPTRALIFGDLLDKTSEVTKITINDPRRYHVLEDLNTKPAVTYLKRVINDV